MSKKKALITGITGQDGSYLAELLLKKKYQVIGLVRRSSSINTSRIDHLLSENPKIKNNSLYLMYGDMTDGLSLKRIIEKTKPDEIYNLAAQSHVGVSFDEPEYTADAVALGTLRILENIRLSNRKNKIKFYNASTSEIFGNSTKFSQSENTPFHPQSPYGIAKLYAHWITINYRTGYGLFASNGILFNHESPRRGETFVTKKIVNGLVRIKYGLLDKLYIGNLNAKRDWGHAKDYVQMQHLILQQKKPDDFIIATGKQTSVREFINITAKKLNIRLKWSGKGIREKGYFNGKSIIEVKKNYYRPAEVNQLKGNITKARKKLGWKPKTTIYQLIDEMIKHEIAQIS